VCTCRQANSFLSAFIAISSILSNTFCHQFVTEVGQCAHTCTCDMISLGASCRLRPTGLPSQAPCSPSVFPVMAIEPMKSQLSFLSFRVSLAKSTNDYSARPSQRFKTDVLQRISLEGHTRSSSCVGCLRSQPKSFWTVVTTIFLKSA
jgi:hypothetical protein